MKRNSFGIFGGWCSFSYFDCAVHVQMTGINSENDPEAFARALAVLERNEAYRALCAEYVQLLQTQYMRSNNGQTRIKLMTFGIESESVKGARSRLTRIGLDMQGNFKKIGVESRADGRQRAAFPAARAVSHGRPCAVCLSVGSGCRKPDYPPKTSSRPAALISRRPARLRSGKHIAPRRTSRFKRRA